MKKLLAILIIFLFVINCKSQNLVRNPDFEIFYRDSTYFSYGFNLGSYNNARGYRVDGWRSILMQPESGDGVSHIYDTGKFCNSGNSCIMVCLGYPENYALYSTSIAQGKLLRKLEKDKKYKIEFYIKKSSNANAKMSRVDVYFGGERFDLDTIKTFKPAFTYIGEYLSDSYRWVKIEGEIIAKGNERYIYFGAIVNHFENCEVLNKNTYLNKFANYYIDNIQLIEIKE